MLLLVLLPMTAFCQDIILPDSATIKEGLPERKLDFNEFDFGFTTFRYGVAAIEDYAAYTQDETAKAQMDSANVKVVDQWKWRDARFFAAGKFNMKRSVIWKVGVMYDGSENALTFRETGLLIGLPEIKGNVFIGRSKEGYSLNKDQNGYSCYGNERQMSLDVISIMADGIRVYGYLPKPRFFYSVGAFTNAIYGPNTKFDLWEWQVAGRFGYRPIYDVDKIKLLHLGVNLRIAQPDENTMQVRSRPESNPAPYFLDTGPFPSDLCKAIGWEAHYRNKSFMIGSEGNFYTYNSDTAGNPTFFGANVYASYILTGEAWPWLSDRSVFTFVKPNKSFFDRGLGAIELLCQLSIYNLNDGLFPGGQFWKITPMINWYLNYNFRVEFVYGYGVLDRFNLKGATQFFQTRFQFQLL